MLNAMLAGSCSHCSISSVNEPKTRKKDETPAIAMDPENNKYVLAVKTERFATQNRGASHMTAIPKSFPCPFHAMRLPLIEDHLTRFGRNLAHHFRIAFDV
jgi:hypothetical protein